MKRGRQHFARWASVFVLSGCLGATQVAWGATVNWVDWTSADATSASGSAAGIAVSFSGNLSPAAQTGGGTNFWASNSSTYTGGDVDNPPPDSDIIRLNGGSATGTQTLTFGSPVTDPVMAIMSMGQLSVQVDYDFDTPFDILNQGPGFFDAGGNGSLLEVSGDILRGFEGHGLIQFEGTVTSISWTMPRQENWHGFQVGIFEGSSSVPEPVTLVLLALGLAGVGFSSRRLH